MKKINTFILLLLTLSFFYSCRDDQVILTGGTEVVDNSEGTISSFYLLNEGNMGMNRATIDYYDSSTGSYISDIYAKRNPNVVKELGDVGNDIKIYGSKLYAVINCSNYIEVMDVKTTKHLGAIEVPNCRNLTFNDGKAYVSSYSGPVQITPNAEPGFVAEIDTTSLKLTRKVTVGYQPEQMAIINNKLYVANSGGYRVPDYDRRVSVIDLNTFTVTKNIDVAINLHNMLLDKRGDLYVSSRGNYKEVSPRLHIIDTQTNTVKESLDIPISQMCMVGDSLYYVSTTFSYITNKNTISYGILNTKTKEIVTDRLITDGTDKDIMLPYGIAVDPKSKQFIITDAQNYVVSGYIYCFNADGKLKWKIIGGNIPAHIAFTNNQVDTSVNPNPGNGNINKSPYITSILEYKPAPGQFVNELPEYQEGETQSMINKKVLDCLAKNKQIMVTLGGYGGYLIAGFDHTIENKKGDYDFQILGNMFAGSSEPGIVMVAYDKNKNGYPDDEEWYELAGSEYNASETIHGYQLTYYRTPENHVATPDANNMFLIDTSYIQWRDNQGKEGYLAKSSFHKQNYYPGWIKEDQITFEGTLLTNNAQNKGTVEAQNYFLKGFDWGYADNRLNNSDESKMKIDWAVDRDGNPVELIGIDWVKIYTGQNQQCSWIGEASTEVLGITDLHILNQQP